jgi:hypothetical protein
VQARLRLLLVRPHALHVHCAELQGRQAGAEAGVARGSAESRRVTIACEHCPARLCRLQSNPWPLAARVHLAGFEAHLLWPTPL